jgi:hypothetical protein
MDAGAINRFVISTAPDVGGFSDEIQKITDESVTADLLEATDNFYLAKISPAFGAVKSEFNTEVRAGSVIDSGEVLAALAAEGVDVVPVETHGRSGFSRSIFGRVADMFT